MIFIDSQFAVHQRTVDLLALARFFFQFTQEFLHLRTILWEKPLATLNPCNEIVRKTWFFLDSIANFQCCSKLKRVFHAYSICHIGILDTPLLQLSCFIDDVLVYLLLQLSCLIDDVLEWRTWLRFYIHHKISSQNHDGKRYYRKNTKTLFGHGNLLSSLWYVYIYIKFPQKVKFVFVWVLCWN